MASCAGFISRIFKLILVAYGGTFSIFSTNWALILSHLL
jgi:hypothetical protein